MVKKSATEEAVKEEKLTAEQTKQLGKQELRIQGAQDSFFELVDALHIIEADQLYIPHRSLSAYAWAKWDMTDSRVTQYRSAWVVLNALKAAGVDREQLPKNEGQTRILSRKELTSRLSEGKFDTKKAVKVWKKLIASGDPITAAAIVKQAKALKYIGGTDEASTSTEEGAVEESETAMTMYATQARATATNVEGTYIEVVAKVTQEQADLLNALFTKGTTSFDAEKGMAQVVIKGVEVASVFVGFAAFVNEHKLTGGAVSFVVK
ncbi:MAG TPA: hypothetical protein VFG04_03880 [Planctomycetaceae bacterium]|nr:hypothetical protein [Planctomycetaceae bacterium]